jgi:hypothetical protein
MLDFPRYLAPRYPFLPPRPCFALASICSKLHLHKEYTHAKLPPAYTWQLHDVHGWDNPNSKLIDYRV